MPRVRDLNLLSNCALMLLAGAIRALGVFTNAIDEAAPNGQPLGNTWASSMGIMAVVFAPVMFLAGLYIDNGKLTSPSEKLPFGQSKTHRIRILSFVASASFGLLALAGVAVEHGSASLLLFSATMQSIPVGIYYVLTVEVLAAWMPKRQGLAVGCCQMAYGFGPVLFSPIFTAFLTVIGCVNALYTAAILLSVFGFTCTYFLEWPSSIADDTSGQNGNNLEPYSQGVKIPWRRFPFLLPFWNYMITVFMTQLAYAFYPYFFEIGLTFKQPMYKLVNSFQIANLLGTFARLAAGVLADRMGCGWGPLYSGAKNLMLILLVMQSAACLLLASWSNSNNFTGFSACVGIMFIVFGGGSCDAVVLARDMFSPANSAIVFGIGAGFTIGLGEAFSSALMARVESWMPVAAVKEPGSYNMFYLMSALFSFCGFLACLFVERCEEAFEIPCSDGTTTVLVDSSLVTVPTASHYPPDVESKALDIPGSDDEDDHYEVTRVQSFSFRTPSYVPVQRIDGGDSPATPFGTTAGFIKESLFVSV